jgi:hypothetical protein
MITAKEFDEKFDNNEDITPYLDLNSKLKLKHLINSKKVDLDFPENILELIEKKANNIGVEIEALLKIWIVERLQEEINKPI